MDFSFTEDQAAIRDSARRFARERLAPGYAQRESEGRIGRELIREMAALGFIGADLPAAAGGLGQTSVTAGILIEEIAFADINVAYVQLLASLTGAMVAAHGREPLTQEIIAGICTGEMIVALALTEPRGGSDAAHLEFRAERRGDDYRLNGEKTSISMAEQADYALLFARTDPSKAGAGGVSAFLVPLDSPGISRSSIDDVGSAAVGRGSLFFDDVTVAAGNLIGREGAGFRQVMRGFDYSRALIGLQCLAPAKASLTETWQYITERKAFGNALASYQGVTEPLAEAETLLEAARLLCYKTLWLRDANDQHTAEAAMCKWWAPKTAFETIHRCLLTHGHSGYARDLPHQQRLRDVMGLQIGDGTEQIQKMVIAREKVGRIAVPY
ncbi:MAG: acyl-CoA dehydrogenase family protein [Gammaproteobacteria bacterium]|nr:acyl-CoA dehydrogenase family protein [Gammaproteobacteria bacterium]